MRGEPLFRVEQEDCAEREPDVEDIVLFLCDRGLLRSGEAATILGRLLELSFCAGWQRLSVRGAAAALHVSRRTLGRHCQDVGLPAPSEILCLGRILRTVRAARRTDKSVTRVALETGWPDAFTFSNATLRMTGLRAAAAVSCGVLAVAEVWVQTRGATNGTASGTSVRRCRLCGQVVG